MSSQALPDPVDLPDLTEAEDTQGDAIERHRLPPKCPVIALGIEGLAVWILDHNKQLHRLKSRDMDIGTLQLLFGGDEYLRNYWPRWSKPTKDKPSEIIGFDQREANSAVINAATIMGVFNPQGRVFGRGAHRVKDDQAALVLHMGDQLEVSNAMGKRGQRLKKPVVFPTGEWKRFYFPGKPKLPAPAPFVSTKADAEEIRDLFRSWNWIDADASSLILMGLVAEMFICGALDWRAHVWLVAPTGSGKSTLQKLIRTILGDWIVHCEDATEAGVRNRLNDDTLGVLLDEAEPDDNPVRQQAMLNLARKSSSGGLILRGTADQKGQEYVAQSAFLLSSIIHSITMGQDRNRFAILSLKPFKKGVVRPKFDWKKLDDTGRKMHRRMLQQWPRYDETWEVYKAVIRAQGLEPRIQDTFGTLLACADMLLYDEAPILASDDPGDPNQTSAHVIEWVETCMQLMWDSKQEARNDVDRCIQHLMTTLLPAASGHHQETVARWVKRAVEPEIDSENQSSVNKVARQKLKSHGLRVVRIKDNGKASDGRQMWGAEEAWCDDWHVGYLAIAGAGNRSAQQLFEREAEWRGGKHIQSLEKIDGAKKTRLRFDGRAEWAVAVPLKALFGSDGKPEDDEG